jgi:hypothetical protein
MQRLTKNSIREILMLEANPRRIQPFNSFFQVVNIQQTADDKIFYSLSDEEFYYEFFLFNSKKVKELGLELYDIILIERLGVFLEYDSDKEQNLKSKIKVFKICKYSVAYKAKSMIGQPKNFQNYLNCNSDCNSHINNSGINLEHVKTDVDSSLNLDLSFSMSNVSQISERKILKVKRISVGQITKYSISRKNLTTDFSQSKESNYKFFTAIKEIQVKSKENSINSSEEFKKNQDSIGRHLSELKKEDEEFERKKIIDSKSSFDNHDKINSKYTYSIYQPKNDGNGFTSPNFTNINSNRESDNIFMTPIKDPIRKSFPYLTNCLQSTLKKSACSTNLFSHSITGKRITIDKLKDYRDKNINNIYSSKNIIVPSQIYEVKCRIKGLNQKYIQTYEGCPECLTKLNAEIVGWKCFKCDLTYSKATIYFNLLISFYDHTGEIFLYLSPLLSDKLIKNICKIETNAKEYRLAYEKEDEEFLKSFEWDIKYTELLLKIKLLENYLNNKRYSYSPISNSKRSRGINNNQIKIDVKDLEIISNKKEVKINLDNIKNILNLN